MGGRGGGEDFNERRYDERPVRCEQRLPSYIPRSCHMEPKWPRAAKPDVAHQTTLTLLHGRLRVQESGRLRAVQRAVRLACPE